jgi:SAM-dependent methyltransferase
MNPTNYSATLCEPKVSVGPQELENGQIHDWYRIVHGYSDHLVSGLLAEFDIDRKDLVLDPFCGTGTTLVECMKKSISSVGVDANPSSCFAARVKTKWDLSTALLENYTNDFQDSTVTSST